MFKRLDYQWLPSSVTIVLRNWEKISSKLNCMYKCINDEWYLFLQVHQMGTLLYLIHFTQTSHADHNVGHRGFARFKKAKSALRFLKSAKMRAKKIKKRENARSSVNPCVTQNRSFLQEPIRMRLVGRIIWSCGHR